MGSTSERVAVVMNSPAAKGEQSVRFRTVLVLEARHCSFGWTGQARDGRVASYEFPLAVDARLAAAVAGSVFVIVQKMKMWKPSL
jgi:hypothetical protein